MASLPELKVTVFSDYICPFCYVGHHRLQKLRDSYDLKINWCFIEIHPETSAEGRPIDSLQYSQQQWTQMMENLKRIASEEDIPLSELSFVTNSKDALLLSEAAKSCGREVFYSLHEKLFYAYFVEGKNIGDRGVLRSIATSCNVDETTMDTAWNTDQFQKRLVENFNAARHYKIQSVPSFVFGDEVLAGVVSDSEFRRAAKKWMIE